MFNRNNNIKKFNHYIEVLSGLIMPTIRALTKLCISMISSCSGVVRTRINRVLDGLEK